MRVVTPGGARPAGRVEQHVVAAQQARRDRQQAGALDEGGPRSRAARGVLASASRSAAPNAAVQPPATRKPASMIHGSRASGAARPLS